ncbi:hypothetical protein M9458_015245, partial [Cirrhinus mrigala]
VGEQILMLRQGKGTAAEFALAFRTLAAQMGWLDEPLKLPFWRGLSHEQQAELTYRDKGKNLDELTDLTIHIDNLIRSRKPNRSSMFCLPSPPLVSEQEAMQVGHTRLSPEERDHRFQQNLCLYCGQAGHMKVSCPSRPKQHAPFVVNQTFHTSKSIK